MNSLGGPGCNINSVHPQWQQQLCNMKQLNCTACCNINSVASTVVVATMEHEATVQPAGIDNMATIVAWWQL